MPPIIQVKLGPNSYVKHYNTAILTSDDDESIRIFGYCRVSTEKQEDNYSLESQQRSINNLCKWNKKYILVSIYVDSGISSSTLTDRPGYMAMITKIAGKVKKNGELDGSGIHMKYNNHQKICVYTNYLSRITRSEEDMAAICKFYTAQAINLISGDCPGIDMTSDHGRDWFKTLSKMNQKQKDSASMTTKNDLRQLQEKGKLRSGNIYGWKVVKSTNSKIKNQMVEVEDEQEGIRKIIEIWDNNDGEISNTRIAEIMNEEYPDIKYYRGKGRKRNGDEDQYSMFEWNGKWSLAAVSGIISRHKFKTRKSPNEEFPINFKDERVRHEINKMYKEGIFRNVNYKSIAREIDDLCIFNAKTNPKYIQEILSKACPLTVNLGNGDNKNKTIITYINKHYSPRITMKQLCAWLNKDNVPVLDRCFSGQWNEKSISKFMDDNGIKRY